MNFLRIILITTFLVTTFSCDLFNSEESPGEGGVIIGNWLEKDAVINLSLTTNSAQTANNFLNSTGEIAVTGDYNTKLTLMIEIPEDEEEEADAMLIVTNTMGFVGQSDTTYMLGLDPTGLNTEGALIVSSEEDDFSANLTNQTDFSFNDNILTINNSLLQDVDTQTSATISGTISSQQVNISANTPTLLSFKSSQFYEFGNTVTSFYDDGKFDSSEDTGIGDTTGTWVINGDTLKITTAQEVEDITTGEITYVDTSWSFNYVNTGNKFILSQTIDICELSDDSDDEEDYTCAELFEIIEMLFQLDPGSITNADLIYQLIFERIPDNQVAKISNETKNPRINSIPQNIKQFLIESKRQI